MAQTRTCDITDDDTEAVVVIMLIKIMLILYEFAAAKSFAISLQTEV